MPLVNIGDGGPPIDIPAGWLPDWQQHVRAAIEHGAHLRRVASAKANLRNGLGIATVALRTGLPRDEVARLAAHIRGTDNNPVTVADEQRILDYPLAEPDDQHTHPSQWPTRRNPPHRIRLLIGSHDHELELPTITITITPINQPEPHRGMGENR